MVVNKMSSTIQKSFTWVRSARRCSLSARHNVAPSNWLQVGVGEQDMNPIQAWCEDNKCGIRTSFDTFQFKSNAEMTMFLLRWGS
jgi:hypothetical protein